MCRCLGVNLLQWNVLLEASKTFKVNPRHPNILPLLCIWVKCAGVWGNIFPKKWAVFIKLYPMSKARMSLSKNLPQTSKKFTQIYLPYLWHYATLAIASPSSYPCQWVSQWVSESFIVSDWRLLSHLRALQACFGGINRCAGLPFCKT